MFSLINSYFINYQSYIRFGVTFTVWHVIPETNCHHVFTQSYTRFVCTRESHIDYLFCADYARILLCRAVCGVYAEMCNSRPTQEAAFWGFFYINTLYCVRFRWLTSLRESLVHSSGWIRTYFESGCMNFLIQRKSITFSKNT